VNFEDPIYICHHNIQQRTVVKTLSSHKFHNRSTMSSSTVVTSVEDSENPLMALVDAAASMLDKSAAKENDFNTSAPPSVTGSSESDDPADSSTCDGEQSTATSAISLSSSKKHSFAEHLMNILEDGEKPGADPSLVWMPDGLAFTIVNPKKFTSLVMPKLFQIRNMSSFVRKLGRWGFYRVHEVSTKNSDIFKHAQFHRGNRDLCAKIKCISGAVPSPPSTPNHTGTGNRNRVITLNKEPKAVHSRTDQVSALQRRTREAIGNSNKQIGKSAPIHPPKGQDRKTMVESLAPLLGEEQTMKSPQAPSMLSFISHQERSPISALGIPSNNFFLSAALETMRRERHIENQALARAGYLAATTAAAASVPSLESAANAVAMEYLFKSTVASRHHHQQRQQELAAHVLASSARLPSWLTVAASADQLYAAAAAAATTMNEQALPNAGLSAGWGRGFPTSPFFS
jgi:HSF-type DNA-binding